MNYDQMTLKTQDAIQEAGKLAMQKSSSEIGNEHLLTAMLRQKDGTIPPLVERIGVQPETLLSELDQLIDQYPTVSGNTQMTLSSEAQRTLALAEKEMESLKDLYLSTEHLFLAMTEAKDKAGDLLSNADELKAKAVELGKSIAPDSLDPKVEEVVDKAVDFLTDKLSKKDEK